MSNITVREVIELYLKSVAARVADDDFSRDHFKNAARQLRLFATKHGSQTIAECKQHDVSEWLADHPEWKAVDTKRGVTSCITACFNWALEEELIERSPYRRPRILRGKTGAVRRPATHQEYQELMRQGSRPLRRALYFLRKTGARTCEMYNVTWDEVFLAGPAPYISMSRHKTFRQSGKPRVIGLDPSTARFLRNLARQFERRCNCDCGTCVENICPNVFTNSYGTPWDRHTFPRHLRRCALAIGLDEGVEKRVSAYCLRHMYTVDAIVAGVSTRKIADQLGHGTTTMIDTVYGSHTRQSVNHLSSVAEEINRKRNKQTGKGTSE